MRPYLKINKWKRKSGEGRSSLGVSNLHDLDYEPRWADTSSLMQLCVTCNFHLEILSDGSWDTAVTLSCSQVHIWGSLACPPQMSTFFPAPVPASQIWWGVCPVLLLLSPLYLPPAREWIQIHRGDLASDTFWEGSKSKHLPVSCFPCHRKVYMRGCRRERSKVKGWPNLADCLWTPQEKRWQNLKPLFSGDCCRWEDWNWGPIGWLPKEGVSGHERCQPSAQIVA